MATNTDTATAEPALTLTPPEPVPSVQAERAAGLVPVDTGTKSELEKRVDQFVADLVAEDANSPEFGKRVDAITTMGAREIREAARAVTRRAPRCSTASTPTSTLRRSRSAGSPRTAGAPSRRRTASSPSSPTVCVGTPATPACRFRLR